MPMTWDEFQGHSARGGKRNYLKGWKDKNPYSITLWFHTQASILALWRHRFLKVVRRNVEGVAKVEVWGDPLVCWEDEDLLQVQNFYDRETRTVRDRPPEICGHCKMLEWIRAEIMAKRLDWREPLFKYECDDPSKTVILHAGGMCGLFGDKKMSEEKKRELILIPKERGGPVYQRGFTPNVAYRQDSKAKLEYAFAAVDNAEPTKGIQVAIEPNLVGLKIQEVIAHARKAIGERGNIAKYPYAIQLEHNPAEGIAFDKKYDAIRMEQIRMTPMIEKLIVHDPPPSFDELARRHDPNTHMANLERQVLVKLPFEQFFAKARAEWKTMKDAGAAEPAGTRVPEVGRPALPPALPMEDPDEEVMCNAPTPQGPCTHVMKMRDPKCSACGKVYIIEADPLPLPPPMRTRTQEAPYVPPPAADHGNAGDPGDDIPFIRNAVMTSPGREEWVRFTA